jgi:hypothetical protein
MMQHLTPEGVVHPWDAPPLSPVELSRLRRLTSLSDSELDALANVGIGVVTAGRIRTVLLYLLATIGAIASTWIASMQVWTAWKNH